MIKDYIEVKPQKINLGNLGLHNACSYYVDKDPKNYPIAWFGKKNEQEFMIFPDKPENCPKGYQIRKQFDNPTEALWDYAKGIEEEHKSLTDVQINTPANFRGRKRCARWEDEKRRRGLTT